MDRRDFLRGAGTAGLAATHPAFRKARQTISRSPEATLTFNPAREIAVIPPDFMGLGYEISSVAVPGLLSRKNALYVQLVRTLGARGVIRIGGNTSDYASYAANGAPLSSPEGKAGSVVNEAVIRDLGGLLDATGWDLIWGLNLGNGSPENALEEARAVTDAARSHLLAFEIGNEPDLFRRRFRKPEYGYGDYLTEYRRYRDSLRKGLPGIPLAGPDAADATDWVTNFAADEGKDVKLLTHHYYREGQNPRSSIDKLLQLDPKLAPTLDKLRSASKSSGLPYRICEVNSFSGGGRPGVSDTFASALWALDYMFTLASAGCSGVNLETGLNQRGFVSSYSPIGDDEHGHYTAAPEYYGMLAFAQSGRGSLIESTLDASGTNVRAYVTRQAGNVLTLILINKEPQGDCLIQVCGPVETRRGSVLRLTGPALDSKTGVVLGGAAVTSSGVWKSTQQDAIASSSGRFGISLPAASAAIVTLHP